MNTWKRKEGEQTSWKTTLTKKAGIILAYLDVNVVARSCFSVEVSWPGVM